MDKFKNRYLHNRQSLLSVVVNVGVLEVLTAVEVFGGDFNEAISAGEFDVAYCGKII
jgi:hypothetical protein